MTNSLFDATLFKALRWDENDFTIYLSSISDILAAFSWLYETRNLDIYIFDVLEKIPVEWVEVLSMLSLEELWQLPFGFMKDEWPESLRSFLNKCSKLSEFRFLKVKFYDTVQNKYDFSMKKTSNKKQLESQIMSHLVYKICQAVKSNTVLDVGSGLGYLDQALHDNFGICSIGLDSVAKYTQTAKERLRNDSCTHSIIHETMEVNYSEACVFELRKLLNEREKMMCSCRLLKDDSDENQSTKVVMIGLHSCGNLSQDMIRLFCQLEEIIAFICIGCCYNKINLSDFPMSHATKSAVKNSQLCYQTWSPCTSGLRLAAHGTRSHPPTFPIKPEREINMFYRALLEYFVKKENIDWKQPKRHVRTTDLHSFETYCSKMFENHELSKDETSFQKLKDLYQEKMKSFHKIRILLVLQTMLQPLWEMFVTVDRIMYFKENGISAEVVEMWDDSISSRNLALCAYKKLF